MYKILSGKYDTALIPRVNREHGYNHDREHGSITRGSDLRLQKARVAYDLRKYYFTNRAVNIWNSLPNHVVLSDTVNTFKCRLDKFWQHKDIYILKCDASVRLCAPWSERALTLYTQRQTALLRPIHPVSAVVGS